MRARNIKPGFYKNEDLAECSWPARMLAPGLWMMADKEGRLEDRPKRIKGEIFPYDSVDVDLLLNELQQHKHITRYEADGNRYIQINKFSDHQRPHNNEQASVIPPVTQGKSIELCTKVESALEKEESTSLLTTDSLNPSSLKPDSISLSPPKKSATKKQTKNRIRLAEDFIPPDSWRDFALEKGLESKEAGAAWHAFRDYHLAKGTLNLDWDAAWRTWVRNAVKFEAERQRRIKNG